jgi:hypothetical protein
MPIRVTIRPLHGIKPYVYDSHGTNGEAVACQRAADSLGADIWLDVSGTGPHLFAMGGRHPYVTGNSFPVHVSTEVIP